ncbi:MAG TPA: FtsX-like permease family protein [Verrucomicrobiae bacterium]|nr:FtsX-like permease family protein [Verrucomicrobiae bacterium]
MKTPDLLELATRNLRESKLRNSLTTVGISVGVASLVSMLSLGIGLQRMISSRLERVGFNLLTVAPRSNRPPMGANDTLPSQSGEERPLDENARREIEKLPGVAEAYPDMRFNGQVAYNTVKFNHNVVAVPDSVRSSDDFNNVRGSFFSSPAAHEVLLEKSVAAELLGKQGPGKNRPLENAALNAEALAKDLVGHELDLSYIERKDAPDQKDGYSVVPGEVKLKIVGVADIDVQARYGDFRGGIFIPLPMAETLHVLQPGDLRPKAVPSYNFLIVRATTSGQVQKVEDAVKKMGFNVQSIQDVMRSLKQGFAIFDMLLGVFGSLALTVASIGIVNTLVMAILERRREIGIMKAIGASDADVKRVFFAEAGAMGVVGGAIGVALGWLIGRIINFGTNVYLERQGASHVEIWYVSWWLVAGAILFSLGVSLAAGWYPASRASRLDPVEALRYQ